MPFLTAGWRLFYSVTVIIKDLNKQFWQKSTYYFCKILQNKYSEMRSNKNLKKYVYA